MAAWDSGMTDAVIAASAAASDSTRWNDVLATLNRRFGATAAAMHTPAPSLDRALFFQIGLPPDGLSDYVANWAEEDPWFAGASKKGQPVVSGRCDIGRQLCEWHDLERLDFYNGFAKPCGVRGLLTMVLDDGSRPVDAPLTMLSLYRQPGLEEFSRDDQCALQALHSPLQMALHAHWSLARSRQGERIAADALAAVPKAVFVLGGDGAILHANPHASTMLTRRAWIETRSGRVSRLAQMGAGAFAGLVRRALFGIAQSQSLWMPALAPQAGAAYAVARLVPLAEDNACRAAWPSSRLLLLIDEPEKDDASLRLSALASQFRLTSAETRLLAQLASGIAPAVIAEQSRVSIHTVRAHLRSLFDKTGVRRQSELVRLCGGAFLPS